MKGRETFPSNSGKDKEKDGPKKPESQKINPEQIRDAVQRITAAIASRGEKRGNLARLQTIKPNKTSMIFSASQDEGGKIRIHATFYHHGGAGAAWANIGGIPPYSATLNPDGTYEDDFGKEVSGFGGKQKAAQHTLNPRSLSECVEALEKEMIF
ncbi:MAG: hypothetical protein HY457_03500 [Parcubacteria group bacterium]|nr:hypothetical protein [Parcubacteria group bacterium]